MAVEQKRARVVFCLGSGLRLRVVAEKSCAQEWSVVALRGGRTSKCAILCRQRAVVWCCAGRASFLYAGRSLRLVEGRSVLFPDWPPTHWHIHSTLTILDFHSLNLQTCAPSFVHNLPQASLRSSIGSSRALVQELSEFELYQSPPEHLASYLIPYIS